MDNQKTIICPKCRAEMISVKELDFENVSQLWNKLLAATPDDKGNRTVLLEQGATRTAYARENLQELLNKDLKAMAAKYGYRNNYANRTMSFDYLGTPATICFNSTLNGNNPATGFSYVDIRLSSTGYDKHKNQIVVKSGMSGTCPSCGETVIFIDEEDVKLKDMAEATISELKSMAHATESFDRSKNSTVNIQSYLENLIAISQNIYFLENQIRDLYLKSGDPHRFEEYDAKALNSWKHDNESELKNSEIMLRNRESSLLTDIVLTDDDKNDVINELGIDLPAKPTEPERPIIAQQKEDLIEPTKPELKTPGLFNKRKVDEENQKMIEDYNFKLNKYNEALSQKKRNEEELEKYDLAIESYKKACDQYDHALADINEIIKPALEQKKKALIEKNNERKYEEISSLKQKIQSIKQKIETQEGLGSYYAEPFESGRSYEAEKAEYLYIQDQIIEAKDTLLAQYNCLNTLLEPGIVFPKYNDIIAWSTMYEYFVTGRVTELTGPNGAYNLYENEIRANTIISKLDVIINKLDAIRDNQYMLYKAITDSNALLNKMSKCLESVTALLGETNTLIETTNSSIKENNNITNNTNMILERIRRSNEAIAYNTQKTAAYAEITAKTNSALTFMKAVWG